MKTKLHSSFIILHSAFCILPIVLLTATPRAPAQGLWGNALSFDGVDDYVQVGSAVPLTNSSFTFEAWARRNSATTMDYILGQGGGGNSHCLGFGYFHSQFVLGFYGDDLWTTNNYTDTDWHHWAGTYNATNRVRCLYRDGILVASDTAAGDYLGYGSPMIGSVPWTPNAQFDGQLDDVRVWNVVRSQAEIAAQMGSPLAGNQSGLLAYWRFNEGSGSTAHDATGHGYDGALLGAPQWTPSTIPFNPWHNALSFNGTNSYVLFNRPVSNDFTLECWFQSTNSAAGGTNGWWEGAGLIDGECASYTNDFGLAFGPGRALFGTGGSLAQTKTLVSGNLTDGAWHHVAGTRVKSTGALTLFVDGCQVATITGSSTNVLNTPVTLRLGSLATGAAEGFFKGQLDEVRIWDVARTPAQIHEGLCRPLSGTEPNLVAYYRLDEGAGTNAFDATTNHLDGLLVNGPVWTNSTIPPFINITASVAPELPGVAYSSVAWGDYDNDGRLDFLLTGYSASGAISQVWRNTGSGFVNVTDTVAPGLPRVHTSSVAWGDHDNDGRLDFLLTGFSGSGVAISQLWRNTGSGFINITAAVAPELPGVYNSSVAWGDYDNDGRRDFLLTGYTGSGRMAQVWRNTGSGFVNVTDTVAPGLSGVSSSSVAWGDYDNDGGLDFLLTGTTNGLGSGGIAQVWRNTGSGFVNVTAAVAPGLPGVDLSSVAWGDYDNDGRLDFLLTGNTGSGAISQVWRNTGSGFVNVTDTVTPGLPGVYSGRVAWGDYDNDGRRDFLLTGWTASGSISQLWWNTNGGFVIVTATVAPGLPGVSSSSVAWGDYDNDGRLDFLLTGYSASGAISQVWRNIGWTTNTLPAPPTNLAVTVPNGRLAFTWNPSSDGETPTSGLTYNLRVGSTPGGSDIVSPQAGAGGARQLPALGNAQQRLSSPFGSPPTGRLYWSVQAVDTAFAGGPFAEERTFTLWPVLGPDSGPVPGDMNGDGMVDSSEFGAVLPHLNGNGIVTQAEMDMVLSYYYPYVPLCLTNTWGLGGKTVSFALPNSAAGAFSVLVSTNLVNWDYLGPALPRYGFTDTNAPAARQRFYRLSWP